MATLIKNIYGGVLILLGSVGAPALAQQDASTANPGNTWTIPSSEDIRKLLAERMQHNGVGIVVGVIEPNGQRVIAYGRTGARDDRPLDGDTIFQIGSITKVFTGLLLADMIQRGEVRLNDSAQQYLPPRVRMPERVRPISLLDLATHQSGLPSMPTNFKLRATPNPVEAYTVEQLYEFLSSYELAHEPGARAAYSNLGVALLGRLLAHRAGMDYESLLKQRILEPLGMRDTAISLTTDQRRRLAPGHDRYLQPVDTWEMRTLPASGSLRSTVNDMLKLLAAYLGYAKTPLAAAMDYQRQTRQPANGSRALGLSVRRSGNEEQFGHDGGKEGYRSAMGFNPHRGTGVVVLANARTDDAPINIALHLGSGRALASASRAPEPPHRVKLSRKLLDSYSGQYQLSPTEALRLARKDDYLLVDFVGEGVVTYEPSASRKFFSRGGSQITLEVDRNGRPVSLSLREAGRERKAQRIGDSQ